jgi:hypothetical protein
MFCTIRVLPFDRKKGVSSLPFQGESSKKLAEFQAPSDDCPANPCIQNPKSLHRVTLINSALG